MKNTKAVEIRKYYAANWWSVSGVSRKMKLILRKGIPNLKDWRFITLTLDPSLFGSELEGYLKGKALMRRFLTDLKKHLGLEEMPASAWKLEFQKNGWAHWHLYFDYKELIPNIEVQDLWGLGFTFVERCDEKSIHYAFKYAFKPVLQKDTTEEDLANNEAPIPLPDWFLDYYEAGEDGSKPSSLSRVRFWQAQNGFYTGDPATSPKPEEIFSCILPRPMRDVAREGTRKIQVLARGFTGSYKKSAVVVCSVTAASLFSDAGCLVVRGEAAPSYNQGYIVPVDFIKEKITKTHSIKLCQIQQLNRQTVNQQLKAISFHLMRGSFCAA